MSDSLFFDFIVPSSLGDALNEARLDRQLRRAKTQSLAGGVLRDAVDLEHDPARLDPGGPEFRRALALAHADLGRLRRDRHVREDADPDAARALHGAGDRAASRLDLTRVDAVRLQRLEAELAEIQVRSALRGAGDPALE